MVPTEAALFIAKQNRLLCDEKKSMAAFEWCYCTPNCTMRHTNRLENLSVLGVFSLKLPLRLSLTISVYKLAARY